MAERFAAQLPALFVGASMAAGFALTRVGPVKACSASGADLPSIPEFAYERE